MIGSISHQAQKHGPVMHLQLGEISTIVISSAELAKEVMKTHDAIVSGRPPMISLNIITYGFKNIASAPYGEYWRQMKKILILELLTARRVQSFRSIREDEVWNLINNISSQAGSRINLSTMSTDLTLSIISRTAFGKIRETQAIGRLFRSIVEIPEGVGLVDSFPSIKIISVISGERRKLERLHQEIDEILDNVINECRMRKDPLEYKGDCIINALFEFQEQGILQFPFTTEHIKAFMVDVFGGGIGTSSVTIEWAMSEMLKNPATMERAQAEVRQVFDRKEKIDETSIQLLKYLKSVVKETLRLHPPFPLLVPREGCKRVEINGYEIPPKTRIFVNAWAIGRDSSYWTEADRFYPERFLNNPIDYRGTHFDYIPFGAGRRMCPGINKAVAIIELALANLLYHFDWKLPNGLDGENLDMTETQGVAAHRKSNLYLIPSLYHRQPEQHV